MELDGIDVTGFQPEFDLLFEAPLEELSLPELPSPSDVTLDEVSGELVPRPPTVAAQVAERANNMEVLLAGPTLTLQSLLTR